MSISSSENPFVSGTNSHEKRHPKTTEEPNRKNVPDLMFVIMYGVE
jgi:hypothetical protein